MNIEFWFEFGSTYSYPAAMRVEEAAASAGVALRWRPFLLGPIFHSQGWDDSPFNIYPAKGRYMWRDLERLCAGLGLPLQRPSRFPRNGLLAARVATAAGDEPWIGRFVRGIYHANFADDREISDPDVVADVLVQAGQPRTLLERAGADDVKKALRARTEEAAARGIFGAPTFTVGDEVFWGNDRLEAALDWARGGGSSAARPMGQDS